MLIYVLSVMPVLRNFDKSVSETCDILFACHSSHCAGAGRGFYTMKQFNMLQGLISFSAVAIALGCVAGSAAGRSLLAVDACK